MLPVVLAKARTHKHSPPFLRKVVDPRAFSIDHAVWVPARAELAAVFAEHEAEPLCNRLLAAGLPAGPVQKIDQALTNAHTIYRGDVIEKDWYKGVASPIRLERNRPSLRSKPPKFSQHAAEVLGEFGYSKSEIDALVAQGVVCGPERKR